MLVTSHNTSQLTTDDINSGRH